MAFGRKFLSSLIEDEAKVDTIIEAHAEVVDALKDEIDKYKADAEKLPQVQKELDEAKKGVNDGYEEKYNKLKEEYDNYKASVAEEQTRARKAEAYKNLLKEIGVADKRIDTVLKVDSEVIDGIELDDEGNVKDSDKVKETAKESWKDFIETKETRGTNTSTPPESDGKVYKSKDEIMSIKDTATRQKAIFENHDMFGI